MIEANVTDVFVEIETPNEESLRDLRSPISRKMFFELFLVSDWVIIGHKHGTLSCLSQRVKFK